MTTLGRFCERALEAGWLLAIVATPLYFNVYSSRVFEPDKATVLRSVVVLMAAVYLVAFLERRARPPQGQTAPGPSNPLVYPALAMVVVHLLATVISIAPRISWWGSYMRLQGAYTFIAYVALFFIVASTLRRREQVERLVTVALLVSIPISSYGVVQWLRRDPLPWAGDVSARVTSSLGNAIFLAAYLIMVVPLTVNRWLSAIARWRHAPAASDEDWERSLPDLAWLGGLVVVQNLAIGFLLAVNLSSPNLLWATLPVVGLFVLLCLPFTVGLRRLPTIVPVVAYGALFCLQVAAVVLTQSRGPWIGLGAGLVCFAVFTAVRQGRRRLLVAAAVVAAPLVGLLILFNVPGTPLETLKSVPYLGRLGTLADVSEGTGKVRWLIWQGTLELLRERPAPGLEPDRWAALRPWLGYGPDVMALAFNKVYQPGLTEVEARNASPDRNHLNLLDHLVMTGLVGLVAYLVVVGVGLMAGWRSLWASRSAGDQFIVAGLVSGLAAHLVESQVGIVIVATWTYFWVYLALIVRSPVWQEEAQEAEDERAALQPLAPAHMPPARGRRRRARAPLPQPPPRLGRTEGGSGVPWLVAYVALTGAGILVLVSLPPLDNVQLTYFLSYLGMALVLPLGAGFLLSEATPRIRSLSFWSGQSATAVVGAIAIMAALWITVVNLALVSADVYYKRGIGTDSVGRWEDSIWHYQRALRLQPDQDWYYIFFGRAWMGLADKANPRQAGNPPLTLGAEKLLTLDAKAVGAMSKEDLLSAADLTFDRARQLSPLNPDHYANLARLHRFWGETLDRSHLDEAIRYFEEAITVSPRTAHLHTELGRTYLVKGDTEQARQVLERARELDPNFAATYALLGDAYLAEQRWEEALAAHERAMEIDPGSVAEAGAEQRLTSYIEAGRGRELEALMQRIVARYPKLAVARSTYGFVLSRQGKLKEALEQYEVNVELAPKDWIGHRNLAVTYQLLGMLDQATAAAQSALQYAPENQRPALQDYIDSLQGRKS